MAPLRSSNRGALHESVIVVELMERPVTFCGGPDGTIEKENKLYYVIVTFCSKVAQRNEI